MRHLSSTFISYMQEYRDENAKRPYIAESSVQRIAIEEAMAYEARFDAKQSAE